MAPSASLTGTVFFGRLGSATGGDAYGEAFAFALAAILVILGCAGVLGRRIFVLVNPG